ncbi:unnamed protein product [Phaedon cochleariae]|uniref:Endonuclease-reverse transcriptase n=1 Tax=Phaedon cochleariae TaxID=80249 RepID=A0A9P0DH67_PHACE|nr:unnamed protein product [Phaedon cochleariae]
MPIESDILAQLKQFIREENNKQTEALKKNFKEEIDGIKSEIYELRKNIEDQADKVRTLENSTEILEQKFKNIDRRLRKNNIVIFGFNVPKEDLIECTIAGLNQLLNLDLQKTNINNIQLIGKRETNRPILVEFVSYLTKQEVLKNCKNLKGSKISITEDLSKEDQLTRKSLLKHQAIARHKGMNAYIRGNKLVINKDIYSLEELDTEDHHNIVEAERASSAPPTPIAAKSLERNQNETENPQIPEFHKSLKDKKQEEEQLQVFRPITRHFSEKSTGNKKFVSTPPAQQTTANSKNIYKKK